MAFCKQCGTEAKKGDLFCRSCGTKIVKKETKPLKKDKESDILSELKSLVDTVAKEMKKELLSQVAEIEKGLVSGDLTKEEFNSEAKEMKGRFLEFILD